MAVSYTSQVIKSSPYQLPLDLNLFSRVMEVKQTQFNQGAAKAQAGIDALGQLDVMREQDRKYLNDKINGLVQGVNSLGGVDYSDAGIQNQIEGLGSDIYGDNNVITAVSSTRSARNLINQYENFKTNPKLKGNYSEVNEWYDKRKINEWLQNPNVGAQYQGPSSATPYNDYKTSFIKALEKVKADQNITLDDRGLYIIKGTNKEIPPERIQQLAQDLLTPEQRSQMKRDATFLYTQQAPQSPEQLVNRSINQYNEKINSAESAQRRYETLASAAVNDPLAQQNYLQLAAEQKAQVSQLKQGAKSVASSVVSALQNDPEELMYQLYSNDFNRGLSNMFSYRQTDRSMQEDKAEMFQLRQAEDSRQFNLTYNQRDRIAKENNDLELLKIGLKYDKDENGNVTLKKIPAGQVGSLESVDPNVGDPDDFKVTEVGLQKENQQRAIQIDQANREIISSLQVTNPNMFVTEQSANAPGGWLYSLKGQADLEGRNNIPGLQMEDFVGLEWASERDKVIAKGHLTEQDLGKLAQWYKDYDALTKGRKPLSGNLPQAFIQGVEKAQLLRIGLDTNNATIDAINQAVTQEVVNKAKLTKEEGLLYQDYLKNPQKYTETNFSALGSLGPGSMNTPTKVVTNTIMKRILSQIKSSNVDTGNLKKSYYEQRGVRGVRFGRAFNEQEIKARGTEFQNFIYSDATANGGEFIPLQGSEKVGVASVKSSQITPLRSGISSDGKPYIDSQITIGTGESQTNGMYRTYLSDRNAKSVGVYSDPYDDINHSLYMTGKADNIYIHGGEKLALKIVISKATDNINDGTSQAWAYLSNGTKVLIPGAQGSTGSETYAMAKAFIQQADAAKISQEDLIKYMISPETKPNLK